MLVCDLGQVSQHALDKRHGTVQTGPELDFYSKGILQDRLVPTYSRLPAKASLGIFSSHQANQMPTLHDY